MLPSPPKANPQRQQHQVAANTGDPFHSDDIFMNPFPNLLFVTPHIPPPVPGLNISLSNRPLNLVVESVRCWKYFSSGSSLKSLPRGEICQPSLCSTAAAIPAAALSPSMLLTGPAGAGNDQKSAPTTPTAPRVWPESPFSLPVPPSHVPSPQAGQRINTQRLGCTWHQGEVWAQDGFL